LPQTNKGKSNNSIFPIKLICFDLDDTLIYTENDKTVKDSPLKYTPIGDYPPHIGPNKVIDGPNKVQVLIEGVRGVLKHLSSLCTLTWASMGPYFQMKRFCDAFRISKYFDWEIGAYDRQDKGKKVELCMEHYNGRLLSQYAYGDPRLQKETIRPYEILFVDDNFGYLNRVESYMPDVKVLWAHYRSEGGMMNFYRDLEEQLGFELKPMS